MHVACRFWTSAALSRVQLYAKDVRKLLYAFEQSQVVKFELKTLVFRCN